MDKVNIDCDVRIHNARALGYDPEKDAYLVLSPEFCDGAWVKAENMIPREN